MKKALSIMFVVLLLVTVAACAVRKHPSYETDPDYKVDVDGRVIQTPAPTATPEPPATPVPTPVPLLPFTCTINGTELDSDLFTMTVPENFKFESVDGIYRVGLNMKKDTNHNFYVVSKDHSLIANGVDKAALEEFISTQYGTNRTFTTKEYEEIHREDGTYGIRMLIEVDYRGDIFYVTYCTLAKDDTAIEFITASPMKSAMWKNFAEELYEDYGTIEFK